MDEKEARQAWNNSGNNGSNQWGQNQGDGTSSYGESWVRAQKEQMAKDDATQSHTAAPLPSHAPRPQYYPPAAAPPQKPTTAWLLIVLLLLVVLLAAGSALFFVMKTGIFSSSHSGKDQTPVTVTETIRSSAVATTSAQASSTSTTTTTTTTSVAPPKPNNLGTNGWVTDFATTCGSGEQLWAAGKSGSDYITICTPDGGASLHYRSHVGGGTLDVSQVTRTSTHHFKVDAAPSIIEINPAGLQVLTDNSVVKSLSFDQWWAQVE